MKILEKILTCNRIRVDYLIVTSHFNKVVLPQPSSYIFYHLTQLTEFNLEFLYNCVYDSRIYMRLL